MFTTLLLILPLLALAIPNGDALILTSTSPLYVAVTSYKGANCDGNLKIVQNKYEVGKCLDYNLAEGMKCKYLLDINNDLLFKIYSNFACTIVEKEIRFPAAVNGLCQPAGRNLTKSRAWDINPFYFD
jgi:hypothetical protein